MEIINMVRNQFFLCFLVCHVTITSFAQKVSNISFKQEQSNIIVTYDLESKLPSKVSLFVSTNGGVNWLGPLEKVYGSVGYKINSGRHQITWNVLEEFEELRGDNVKFQVSAISDESKIVTIGNQEWTTKNLNVSKYRNGDVIPEVKDPSEWSKLITGAWCYYNNDPKSEPLYGKLYNWYAVNDPRGLAPDGFHIPSTSEWDSLIEYLGGEKIAGAKLKSKSDKWKYSNSFSNNNSSFTALPSGHRFEDGKFYALGNISEFWSSEQYSLTKDGYKNSKHASVYGLSNESENILKQVNNKSCGLSIRCTKDKETVKIGSQEWTTKNLDVSTYRNGDKIPEVKSPTEWENITYGAWCYYNNDPDHGAIYGKLYNSYAVNDSRGLAPEGYHIPSEIEIKSLYDYLGGEYNTGGYRLREENDKHWRGIDYSNNFFGFKAIPGGVRTGSSRFYGMGLMASWLCSLNPNQTVNKSFHISSMDSFSIIDSYIDNSNRGFSIRCIKD